MSAHPSLKKNLVLLNRISSNQSAVESSVDAAFDDPRWSDLSIVCSDSTCHVHRIIVCAQSEFLREACKNGSAEDIAALVDLPDEDPDDVKRLLRCMYTGGLSFPMEDPKGSPSDYEEDDPAETRDDEQVSPESENKDNRGEPDNEETTGDSPRSSLSVQASTTDVNEASPAKNDDPESPTAPSNSLSDARHQMFSAMRMCFLSIRLGVAAVTTKAAFREFCRAFDNPFHVDFPLVLDTFYSQVAPGRDAGEDVVSTYNSTKTALSTKFVDILCCPETSFPGQIKAFKEAVMDVAKARKRLSQDVISVQLDLLAGLNDRLERLATELDAVQAAKEKSRLDAMRVAKDKSVLDTTAKKMTAERAAELFAARKAMAEASAQKQLNRANREQYRSLQSLVMSTPPGLVVDPYYGQGLSWPGAVNGHYPAAQSGTPGRRSADGPN